MDQAGESDGAPPTDAIGEPGESPAERGAGPADGQPPAEAHATPEGDGSSTLAIAMPPPAPPGLQMKSGSVQAALNYYPDAFREYAVDHIKQYLRRAAFSPHKIYSMDRNPLACVTLHHLLAPSSALDAASILSGNRVSAGTAAPSEQIILLNHIRHPVQETVETRQVIQCSYRY